MVVGLGSSAVGCAEDGDRDVGNFVGKKLVSGALIGKRTTVDCGQEQGVGTNESDCSDG